jgi:hypothetical protein
MRSIRATLTILREGSRIANRYTLEYLHCEANWVASRGINHGLLAAWLDFRDLVYVFIYRLEPQNPARPPRR